MSRHVTVGLDGSPESYAAAEWAARESLLRKVPLYLVHADDWPMTAAVPVAGPDVQRRWGDKLLADAAEEMRRDHPSLEITTRRLSGRPAAALSIEAGEAEMLVLGSRGLSGIMGFLVGSVGMATISATEQPVVRVRALTQPDTEPRPGSPGPYRDVVVGVDIHQNSDTLLAFAFDESARRGCRLQAVYGWSLPPVVRDALALEGAQQELARDAARGLGDLIATWRRKFPSVDVEESAVMGTPAQLLVHYAADADLVVVGRDIRRAPMGAHIGPIAHAVMHHSTAPVAVIAHD
ncbi:universal stress protein [Streptomyces sp. NPDC054841]